ncbi:MAG: ABC transporter substrate-binding protein, partial [Clostridiales bacterium]|nr:ABC transporter substrate-binding protein [Clostridiales bacterium]
MKKILLLVLSLCLVAALLIFCGAVERDKNIFGSTDEKENTIYIGVIEPLTGDDAPGAMREVLGFRYANAVCPTVDINGVTYNVKLLEADSMSSENGSENAAKSLIYSNVAAVLGAYDSENASYCLPLFEKEKIPVIGVSCSSPKIDADNFFRMCFTDSFQCGAAANLAYSMDCRKAAVLTQTADVYSKAAGKIFADEFSRLGGEVVNLSFQSGQENFKALAEEIKD